MIRRQFFASIVMVTIVSALVAGLASAANPGSLDHSFGTNGKAFVDFSSHAEDAWQARLQPNGKVILIGEQFLGPNRYNWAIARLTANGKPDTTFSGDGKTITNLDSKDDEAWDGAVLPSGKILVVGYEGPAGSNQVAVVRYNANGTRDLTFGGPDGKATTKFPGNNQGYGVTVLKDGRIMVLGNADSNFAVYAFKAGGALDHSFGDNGREVVDFGEASYARRAVVQSDGRILVTGHASGTGGFDVPLVRLMPNGTPDTSFSGDGKTLLDINGGNDEGWGIFALKGGKILVGGYAGEGTSSTSDIFLMRLKPGGGRDNTFGTHGVATFHVPGTTTEYAFGIIRQPNHDVVFAGGAEVGSVEQGLVVRLLPNGQPDTGFGTGGAVTTPIGSEDAEFWGLARMQDGRLVAGGWAGDTNGEFVAARYFG